MGLDLPNINRLSHTRISRETCESCSGGYEWILCNAGLSRTGQYLGHICAPVRVASANTGTTKNTSINTQITSRGASLLPLRISTSEDSLYPPSWVGPSGTQSCPPLPAESSVSDECLTPQRSLQGTQAGSWDSHLGVSSQQRSLQGQCL